MDMNQYSGIFMEESREHLQSMNDILMQLENSPDNMDYLNEIFRIAHTLKGMSATMGYSNMANLTHEMENILDDIRNRKIDVNIEVIDLLFECLDELERYVYNISKHNTEGENTSDMLIDKLKSLKSDSLITNGALKKSQRGRKTLDESKDSDVVLNYYVANIIKKAINEDYRAFLIKVTLDQKCMLKSARAYIVINTLEKIAEIIHSTPSIEDIEDEKFEYTFELVVISKYDKNLIHKEIGDITEIEKIDYIDLEQGYEIDVIDDEARDDKVLVEQSKPGVEKKKDDISFRRSRIGKTVRVDIDRLDNLMNLVSELIIVKTRLEDIHDSEKQRMNEATEHLERITTSLHDAVMKVRMVPIERVFNRFPRMVRDLSRELNKEISLVMTGEETEVDRTVIDEIGDPLIHLLRNSIDHGIEDINTRILAKKPKAGTVNLSAYPDGNSVVIEVEDDGKGIDVEAIKAKAINKNLITLQQGQLMEDNEIVQLLFNPGFSTTDEISDLSGRGVGLDVVKTKIEALGGTVEVDTDIGKGSKFTIRLPLTLAIIQALLVVTGDETYAIPLNNIREISTIESSDIRRVQGNEVVLFRNATLPILRLSELLDVPNTDKNREEYTIVIVRRGDKEAGIVVDELIGQQEIVIKSLGKLLLNTKGIAGATILGNGSIALIVDTNSFF